MPKKLRKNSHREIAVALESIFADYLGPHYRALATHYYEAGVRPKAIEYSTKAGNDLYDKLSYPEACHFLQRSYDLLKRTNASTKLDVGIRLGRNLLRTGQVQQSPSNLKTIPAWRKSIANWVSFCRAEFARKKVTVRTTDEHRSRKK